MSEKINLGLLRAYEKSIPAPIEVFLQAPAMERLKEVGMNCGMEYTSFPFFKKLCPYSRYSHSLGVCLIVYHFTKDLKQAIAGLFHDISTPVFAHTIDFVKGDYTLQEATEEKTASFIASPDILLALKSAGLTLEEVADYHIYPVADNPSPHLSADRLEYTLGNLLNFSYASEEKIRIFYSDLKTGLNEQGQIEIGFSTPQIALEFASLALKNSNVYISPEDRSGMESLAELIRFALKTHVISESDLYTTEPQVIKKLQSSPKTAVMWKNYCGLHEVLQSATPLEGYKAIAAKKRFIDPFILPLGQRVSQAFPEFKKEAEDFQSLSFSSYLKAQ